MIRWKISEMARQIESTQAMLEQLTYQFCTMSKEEQNAHLAGDCALIKVQATKVFEYCAREAAQIMGGVSYVRGGQGEKVERLYREARRALLPCVLFSSFSLFFSFSPLFLLFLLFLLFPPSFTFFFSSFVLIFSFSPFFSSFPLFLSPFSSFPFFL